MDLKPPNADVLEVKWTILAGPSAFVTVTDKVCIDCWRDIDQRFNKTSIYENLTPEELTDFLEHKVITDPEEQ